MPKPDSEKPQSGKPRTGSRVASARTSAKVIAMVPRQHAAPVSGAATMDGRFAVAAASEIRSRPAPAHHDPLLARAAIAVAGFLLGALACYVLLAYRGGYVADMSAGRASSTSALHAQAAGPRSVPR